MSSDPLTEEIRTALASAAVDAQERLSLRGHALYCAAMVYNGWPSRRNRAVADAEEVTGLADELLKWLTARPSAELRERSDGSPGCG